MSGPVERVLAGPLNPGPWGPLVAALLVTHLEEGRSGLRRLWARAVDYRLGGFWYAVILLAFPVLVGGALLLAVLTGEPAPELVALRNPATIPVAFVFIFFLGGPLQEEFGWRGYALARLQERWNALLSSVVVGLFWGLWHLPLFFMPRQDLYYQRPIWGLVASTTLCSVLFTWINNHTRGSILAALLFHTMFNLSHYVFPTLGSEQGSLYSLVLLFLAATTVVIVSGPTTQRRVPRTG